MTLDFFTSPELDGLHAEAARTSASMFASARKLTATMSQVPAGDEARYHSLALAWQIAYAAGCEAQELAQAISAEITARHTKLAKAISAEISPHHTETVMPLTGGIGIYGLDWIFRKDDEARNA